MRALEALGADGLVSADPGVVRMLTGHADDIETGPSVFTLPAIVVASGSAPAILVCSADDAEPSDTVVTHAGFTLDPIDRVGVAEDAIAEALARVGATGARWALDGASMPVGVLPPRPGHRTLETVPPSLTAIKTPEEIAAIEKAVAICDTGQAAVRLPGPDADTELALWARLRVAMETHAGRRLPILADVVTGPRSAGVGGPPTTRPIAPGDLVLVDLVPRVDGMWGDSCATVLRGGEPPPEQRAAHAAACAALEAGMAMLRPGIRSGDIDTAVRDMLRRDGWEYPHHTGHGLGFAYHEEPRIVPGSDTILAAGMVVALEPGAYTREWGLRVERVCVVTDDGPRLISGHDLRLEQTPA